MEISVPDKSHNEYSKISENCASLHSVSSQFSEQGELLEKDKNIKQIQNNKLDLSCWKKIFCCMCKNE